MGVVEVEPKPREYVPFLGSFPREGYCSSVQQGTVPAKLSATWQNMMRRCYDPGAHNFDRYVGVSVCEAWQYLPTFIEQVQKVPQWHLKLADWGGYDLDKDYYGAKLYSPETCVWLSKSDNSSYVGKPVLVTGPFGRTEVFVCLAAAAKRFGVPQQTLDYYMGGINHIKVGKFLGYKIEPYNTNKLVRYAL